MATVVGGGGRNRSPAARFQLFPRSPRTRRTKINDDQPKKAEQRTTLRQSVSSTDEKVSTILGNFLKFQRQKMSLIGADDNSFRMRTRRKPGGWWRPAGVQVSAADFIQVCGGRADLRNFCCRPLTWPSHVNRLDSAVRMPSKTRHQNSLQFKFI